MGYYNISPKSTDIAHSVVNAIIPHTPNTISVATKNKNFEKFLPLFSILNRADIAYRIVDNGPKIINNSTLIVP
jgi:hypothetical protein